MDNSEQIKEVIIAGALELRSVPPRITNEEVDSLPINNQPFLYASGNWGPGYVSIKGLVSKPILFRSLCLSLSERILTPAVRPSNYLEKRLDQITTYPVVDAIRNGADFLVCGSPITKSEDPKESLRKILEEMTLE